MAKPEAKSELDKSTFVEIDSDGSDYELDFVTEHKQGKQDGDDQTAKEQSGDLKGQITHGVATYVWQEGQQRARKAFSLYANIDVLRPYYDVEPHQVRERLVASLIPRFQISGDSPVHVPGELYGPTMLVLTLIAMLLFQMKSQEVSVKEGTLMGTAFGTCFGYWFSISGLMLLVSYICSTQISMIQLLNIMGYALFGHCIVLFITTVFHPAYSHFFFFFMWITLGGLASLKAASILMSRTPGRMQKLIVCGFVISLHLLFLLYLHFTYHVVVEDLSAVFEKDPHLVPVSYPSATESVSQGNRLMLLDALKVKHSEIKYTSPQESGRNIIDDMSSRSFQNNQTLKMSTVIFGQPALTSEQ